MIALIVCAFCALVVSFILTPFFRDFFGFLEMVDRPDSDRKIHARPIPRVGGIPIAISYFVAAGLVVILGTQLRILFDWNDPSIRWMVRFLPAVAVIFATGLFDDFNGLTPAWKIAGQTLASVYAVWVGVRLAAPPGFPTVVTWALCICWLVFCTNAINLIDGIDGLAAGVALLASVSLSLAALIHHHPGLALTNAPLIGALIGFLCYNFNPASVFLGDSGSLLVGFLLGCAGLMWNRHASSPLGMVAPLVAMAVPVAEVTLSIIRRFIRNRPIFGADRNHIHHRLLRMGLSQRGTALALYGASALAALFAVLMTILRPQLAIAALVLFCGIALLCFHWLRYPEFFVLGQFLFAGEFWHSLRQQLYVKDLRDSLASAQTIEECWLALRDTCRQAGLTFVALRVPGQSFVDDLGSPPTDAQSRFEIPVSESVSVIFGREKSNLQSGMLIGPCIEALRWRFGSETADWQKATPILNETDGLAIHSAAARG